jgi:hypothetical protein
LENKQPVNELSYAIARAHKEVWQYAWQTRVGGWLLTILSMAVPVLVLSGISTQHKPETVVTGSATICIPIKPLLTGFIENFPRQIVLLGSPKPGQTIPFQSSAKLISVDNTKDNTLATVELAKPDIALLTKTLSTCDFYVILKEPDTKHP